MNTNPQFDIGVLQRLFTTGDMKRMEDILFYRDDDGSYNLFEQYKILGRQKRHNVFKYGNPVPHQFSALRYALCWCINDRRNKIANLKEIVELDSKLTSLDVEIQIQRSLLNKSVERDLHETKLNECVLKRSQIVSQLQNHVKECDRWQTKRFGHCVNLQEK